LAKNCRSNVAGNSASHFTPSVKFYFAIRPAITPSLYISPTTGLLSCYRFIIVVVIIVIRSRGLQSSVSLTRLRASDHSAPMMKVGSSPIYHTVLSGGAVDQGRDRRQQLSLHLIQLRYDCDSTAVRLTFDCSSTALRPFDDLHYDRRTRPTYCCTEAEINKQVGVTSASGSAARVTSR